MIHYMSVPTYSHTHSSIKIHSHTAERSVYAIYVTRFLHSPLLLRAGFDSIVY
jgi:hypothetical protein